MKVLVEKELILDIYERVSMKILMDIFVQGENKCLYLFVISGFVNPWYP